MQLNFVGKMWMNTSPSGYSAPLGRRWIYLFKEKKRISFGQRRGICFPAYRYEMIPGFMRQHNVKGHKFRGTALAGMIVAGAGYFMYR
jgi:hypothetical protein